MNDQNTGYKIFELDSKKVNRLKEEGQIQVWDKRREFYPNMYVELRDSEQEKNTVLGKVDASGENIVRIKSQTAAGIGPKNREQVFALDALLDDSITVVVLTGPAGTGKTLLTLAAAMDKMEKQKYAKVILTRPMSNVGKYNLGALPGDVNDKFKPYLLNYTTNLEQLVGKDFVQDLIEQCKFDIVPLQLIRGASFAKCFVLADEVQICDNMEILTIGTRIGYGSKLIIMGDLNQRDENIAKEKTGIYKMMHDQKIKNSPLVATIELQKCERSPTAALFAEVFSG